MGYAGYNTRFFFRFESQAGREFRIDIRRQGYAGVAQQRPLGQTPVLKRESGENGVHGTSLEIYAVCRIDGEFAELYTSSAKEYLVVLSEVTGNTMIPIWHGFVTPELYAEPEVAPPYDVQIVATDGLGELKLYDYVAAGRVSLYTHLYNLLSTTGLDATQGDIIMVNSLACSSPSVSAANLLTGIHVDLDHLVDSRGTQYDALVGILSSLHMSITRYADKWLIYRESDIIVSGSSIAAMTAAGDSVSLPVAQYGSMRSHSWYPVGRMDTEVEPAKNRVVVALPYQMRESMMNNPHLPDGTGWIYPTYEDDHYNYVEWIRFAEGKWRPWLSPLRAGELSIYQDISVEQFEGTLTLALLTYNMNMQGARPSQYRVYYRLRLTAGSENYWLKNDDNIASWETTEQRNSFSLLRGTVSEGQQSSTIPVESFDRTEIEVPGLPATGTLRVEIIAVMKLLNADSPSFFLGGVFLTQNTFPGLKDIVVLDNDARGEMGEVIIECGDAPYAPNALRNLGNIFTNGSSGLTSAWATSKFSGELLSVIAMDYALGVALPRLNARGVLNVPLNAQLPMAFVNPDGITMLLLESEWKLLEDNLDVQLRSVPTATLAITSETITELSQEEAQSAGGTGGSSSGGHGGGRVASDPYFDDILNETTGERAGAKALYDLYIIQEPGDEQQQIDEVTKNITEILRHISLQVLNEGQENETTILVTDLTFASEKNLVSGGIGGGGDTPTGGSIATLVDVTLTGLAGGDTLVYNATASHWENKPLLLANLGDVDGAPSNGQTLIYDATTGKWKPGNASSGSLSSVGLTMPTGFSVSGSPLTSDGTIDVSFSSGYGLVTDAERNNFHTHSNKSVLDSITQHKYDHWELAYGDSHTHSNKSTLDNITSTKYNHWESAYDAMGKADYNSSNAALATQAWVGQQNFLTSSDLSGYATQTWVGQQGYVTQAGVEAYLQDEGYATQTWVGQQGYITGVAVTSENAIIGTSLTTIGTVAGMPIKAKIDSYLLATDFTAANIVSTLGNTAVSRATADASGNTITSSYLRKDTDDTMAGNLQIGTSGNKKVLTIRGTTTAAMVIYGNSYSTELYRDSTYLHITSSAYLSGNFVATGNVTSGNASDRRLKEDIRDISLDEAEEMLAALRPVSFRWNEMAGELSDGQLTGVSRGFIADELLAQMPGAGRKMWGEYDAIYYEQVIPYLVAGWQRQNLRLRILEGDIKVLRADNEQLRRRLRGYEL